MRGQELASGVFFPSEDDELYSIPPMSDDQLSLWLQDSPPFSMNSSEDPMLRNYSSDFMELQTEASMGTREDGATQNLERKQKLKRKPSAEAHNLSVRLRRQRHTETINALQEIIPNSNKRDKASTLDEAVKYIKVLQYQVQTMSASYCTFQSSMTTMMSQLGQQGIPSQSVKYEIETTGKFPQFCAPLSQFGIPNACSLPSSSITPHPIQYRGKFMGPLYATTLPYVGAQSNNQGETGPSH